MSQVGHANFGSRWANSEPAWLEAAIRMSEDSCILSKCLKDPSPECDTGCLQVTLASCNLQYYSFANNRDTWFFCLFCFFKKEKSQRSTRLIGGSRKGWRCLVALSVALHKQPLYLFVVSVCLYWCISSLPLLLHGLEASKREKIAWVEFLLLSGALQQRKHQSLMFICSG